MNRWLEHAPESVMDDWRELLANKTLADIARGIERVENAPGKFPPGATEFRKLCAEFQPGTFAGAALPAVSSVVEALESATVEGKPNAYLHMCKRLVSGERLTRRELEMLPPCHTSGGELIRPADFCTASDDE